MLGGLVGKHNIVISITRKWKDSKINNCSQSWY